MKKKVVFVINNFVIGGVEKLILDVITRLDRKKLDIYIITVFGSGPLEASFRASNVPIYFAAGKLPFYKKQWLYKAYWLLIIPIIIARLVKWIWFHRPDVMITSLYQADILGILVAWLTRVPRRVLVHHDVYRLGFFRTYLKKRIGIHLSTKVVAVSETVKSFVLTYFGATNNLVTVINNGINVELFKESTSSSAYPDLVVGMLGRLEPIKGPKVFVKSLEILKLQHNLMPTSYLGGDGSLRFELMEYARAAKLSNLCFDGEITNVPIWMKKVDILIVPSVSEGFGLVILEGLAAGKLVLASDLPATRELIVDKENGWLFPSGDSVALADLIRYLMTNRIAFDQTKREIVEWQQQRLPDYDINKVAKRYERLFLSMSDDDQENKGVINP